LKSAGSVNANDMPLLSDMASDPDLARLRLIAEPWDAAGVYQLGRAFPGIMACQWNGIYRDDLRRFVKGDPGIVPALMRRLDGSVWTTDKDGIVPALLSAEITAHMGRDPGELYRELTREFGEPVYDRVEAPATPAKKERLSKLAPQQVRITQLGGEQIDSVLDRAPGNDRADRRHQGGHRQRLVRRTAIRHRGHLQNLRGELSRRRPPAQSVERGAGRRRPCAYGSMMRIVHT
jgi:hypothetical protein